MVFIQQTARYGTVILTFLLLSFFAAPASASASSCQSNATSGNWSDAAIWINCGGTAPGQNSGDTVLIQAGHLVTLDVMPAHAVTSLTIASGGSLLMNADLEVSGDVENAGILTLPTGGGLTVSGNWRNSGLFTHNDGTVTFDMGDTVIDGDTTFCHLVVSLLINRELSLTDGTVVTIAGNFNRTSSGDMLVTPNTKVIMSGACDGGGTKVIDGAGAKNFYDFEIADGATIHHSARTGNLNVDHDFTNAGLFSSADDVKIGRNFTNSGTFTSTDDTAFSDASEMFGDGTTTFHDITVQGSDTLDANSHDFFVTGDFSVSSGGLFTGDANTVTFNGTAAQQIRSSGTKNFHNVILNNASGLSFAATGAAIASTVEGTLTFIDGRFDVNGERLQFGLNGTVTGVTTTRYIIAACTGEVRKRLDDSNMQFGFPIGDDGADYSPAAIVFASGMFDADAYVSMCVTDVKHPNNVAASNYLTRYWSVDTGGVESPMAQLAFTYLDADVNGDESTYIGGHYNGSWAVDTDAVAGADNTITFDNITDFRDFTASDDSLPITLAYFHSQIAGQEAVITWQTATELTTLGFNLYVERGNRLVLLNQTLIPASGYTTLMPQTYQHEVVIFDKEPLYLEEINLYGKQIFGPFITGETSGQAIEYAPIDWKPIAQQLAAHETRRDTALATDVQRQLTRQQQTDSQSPLRLARLIVDTDGIYHVTHADLLAQGIDLTGVTTADIALINRDKPLPIELVGNSTWDASSAIYFFGTALDTLYTTENVYWLWLDGDRATRILHDVTPPTGSPASFYMATAERADNVRYDTTNSGDDPWYMTRLVAADAPTAIGFDLELDHLVAVTAPISITLDLFGDSSFATTPDHHVRLVSAEQTLIDTTFDGLTTHHAAALAPSLISGRNRLTVTLPHDLDTPYDVVGVEAVRVHYPRAFVAQHDRLDFVSDAATFEVRGLHEAELHVYRVDVDGVTRLEQVDVVAEGAVFVATFAGTGRPARYIVATDTELHHPTLHPASQSADLTAEPAADYLIISHASLIDALSPLIEHHRANGLRVRVVDVADVFDQFSAGVFDPVAIKTYIAHAVANMEVHYVLLVGSDTYDYHDVMQIGSVSLIPSFYRPNGGIVRWGPADPYFADVDDDGDTDVALGRFPARTAAELTTMIDKTLRYGEPNGAAERAIFAADVGFAVSSSQLTERLPTTWQHTAIDLDQVDAMMGRDLLLEQINRGVAFASFFGHSGPTRWTWHGLFNATDVQALTNTQRPTLMLQFGCWNTYYVQPDYGALAHQLMGNGPHGAAAVLGGTTLTNPLSDQLLGEALLHYLVAEQMTLGDALQQAKRAVAQSHPTFVDAQFGYTLLGDPALRLPEFALTSAVMLQSSTASRMMPSAIGVSAILLFICTLALFGRKPASTPTTQMH